jgi:hypothetical protein
MDACNRRVRMELFNVRRGVRAGEAKMNATRGQVGCGGIIHELRAVVSLKALND